MQKAVEVEQGDTPEVLQRRVMEQAEWRILPRAIDLIANGKVKVELALAKGKKLYDKRNDLKEKAAKRDIEKSLKNYY